jgi:hypothetical protein
MLHDKQVTSKLGELGGDGQDSEFEAAFSNLGHAYLREKAPSLEPHEVGFEVLERADDGRRAAGITGFQVGDQLIYSPVFWLSGKIKGSELLFLKDQEMFVPLKENWINYMMERRMPEIGSAVARNPRRLGIRQPDILRTSRSPLKLATADLMAELQGNAAPMSLGAAPPPQLQPFAQQMLPPNAATMPDAQLAAHPFPPEQLQQLSSMADFATEGGADEQPDGLDVWGAAQQGLPATPKFGMQPRMLKYVQRRMGRRAKKCAADLLPSFIRFVGRDAAVEFAKFARAAPGLAQAAYDFHGTELISALREALHSVAPEPAAQRKAAQQLRQELQPLPNVRLVKQADDSFAIQDDRKQADLSRAFRPNVPVQLFNPSRTGIYDVLFKFGKVRKCLVTFSPLRPRSRRSDTLLVALDDGERKFREVDPLSVWVLKQYEDSEFRSLLDGLGTAANLDTESGRYMLLLSARGEVAGPLEIGKILGEADGQTSYSCDYDARQLIVDDGPGRTFRTLEGKLYVPSGAKVLPCSEYRSYGDDLRLGVPSDLHSAFAGFAKLSIHRDSRQVTLNSELERITLPDEQAALWRLVSRHGFSEKTASALLAESKTGPAEFRVKYAAEPYLNEVQQFAPMYDLQEQYGTHMTNSGEAVPETEQQAIQSPVDMPQHQRYPKIPVHYIDGNDDSDTMATAQQAAQSGRKQVFDATVLSTMLRNMRDDQLIDRFVPALARAMDAAGRLLYQFYWHQEDFAERYGDKDMPELEDSLRNIFEGLGDIVLKLKQKTIDPYPEEQNLGVSLTDLAGAS